MSKWLLSAAIVALVSPAVQAQTTAPTNPADDRSRRSGQGPISRLLRLQQVDVEPCSAPGRQPRRRRTSGIRASPRSRWSGHTDTSGNAAIQPEVVRAASRRRCRPSSSASACPRGRSMVSGRGQNDLLVPTADQVREPQNRRVEIIVPQPRQRLRPRRWPSSRRRHRRRSPPERRRNGSRSSWAPCTATISASRTSRAAAARPRTTWSAPSSPSTRCRATSSASA